MTGLGENMNWKNELLKQKSKIDYVTFKLSFVKGWYALKLIDKTGYVMTTSYGNCNVDIHESEVQECLDFLKSNGFKVSEYSVVK